MPTRSLGKCSFIFTPDDLIITWQTSADPNTFGALGKELTFQVQDVADKGSEYSLEHNGFTYVDHASKLSVADYDDNEKLMSVYRPEIEELVKKV